VVFCVECIVLRTTEAFLPLVGGKVGVLFKISARKWNNCFFNYYVL
jgi:hypothetical protein